MPHRIRECGLFPPEDIIRQNPLPLKGVAQEIFSLAVPVYLHLRGKVHHILYKIKIAEWHPCFQGIDRDASIRPKHIVHMQLPDSFLRLLLERLGGGCEVSVFVPEQLVGNFPGKEDSDVRPLVDGLADQIHPHAGTDGGDVVGSENLDDLFQRTDDLIGGHVNLGMVGSEEIRHLPCVFEVDGVLAHADGEGADRRCALPGRDGANQGGIQPAGKEKAYLDIGD